MLTAGKSVKNVDFTTKEHDMRILQTLCYSALLLLLASCSHVYFTEVQPKDGIKLKIIPADIRGTWKSDRGSIQIHETGFTDVEYKLDSNNVLIDSTLRTFHLSDTFMLFKAEDMYVFNYKYESDYWELVVLSKQENGDIHYYETNEPTIFSDDSNLKLIEAKYDIDGEDKVVHELDPDFEDHISFEYAIYSGQMSINTLRQIMQPDYLQHVYRSDGTLFSPSETITD